VADTVWGDVAPLAVSVDFAALEAGFAARAASKPQPGAAGAAPAAGGPRPPARASLLPLQRANNVGIVLTRLRLTPAQVSPVPLLRRSGSGMASMPKTLVCHGTSPHPASV